MRALSLYLAVARSMKAAVNRCRRPSSPANPNDAPPASVNPDLLNGLRIDPSWLKNDPADKPPKK